MSISSNMEYTYKANQVRYYAFLCPVMYEDEDTRVKAYDFAIFDEEGYAWLSITHATLSFLKTTFSHIFDDRIVWTISEYQDWKRLPIPDPDHELVERNCELGYTLDNMNAKFGLDITLLHKPLG